MQYREWRFVDKSGWGAGPWQEEPDKIQFPDSVTGYPCLIVRHPRHGQLCGYVGVPEGHPSYGKGYDEVGVEVHGDLTFAGKCAQPDADLSREEIEREHICHLPDPGEEDNVWWLGFDCAHGSDFLPGLHAYCPELKSFGPYNIYRTVAYVKEQIASLAQQLKERAEGAALEKMYCWNE